MPGDLELAAEARDQQLRIGGAERAERKLAGLEIAPVEPGREHAVEPDRAGPRTAEHAEHVVADRPRVAFGEGRDRGQNSGRGGREIGAGVGRGEREQGRARAALDPGALVEQLGQGAPEARVAGGHRERAFLQSGARDVGAADAAGQVLAARVQGPLHAVELNAGRGIVFGELAVQVLHHVPRDAGVGGHAGRADEQAYRRAGGEQGPGNEGRCGQAEEERSAEHRKKG